MVDLEALFKVSYGLYIMTSLKDGRYNGFLGNTFCQVNSEPPTFQIIVNKGSFTYPMIEASRLFGISALSVETPFSFLGKFGFKTGRDIDKFEGVNYRLAERGVPVILDFTIAYFVCDVFKEVDMGSHTIFIGNLLEAEILSETAPLTYAYYRDVKKGKTSVNAPTYIKPENLRKEEKAMDKYVCEVCGYVYDPAAGDTDTGIKPGTKFEDIPNNWVCPVCGAPKDQFKKE